MEHLPAKVKKHKKHKSNEVKEAKMSSPVAGDGRWIGTEGMSAEAADAAAGHAQLSPISQCG